MIQIPKQLQKEEFRFLKVLKQKKRPFEDNWQTNSYQYNTTDFAKWIEQDGNYGVIGGNGYLRIIDIDNEEVAQELAKKLDTFTIKTGSGEGMHFYIICTYDKNHVFNNKIGEFRASNYMVVGPNCVHPSGGIYSIYNDTEIKAVSQTDLFELIGPYLQEEISTESSDLQLNVTKEEIEKKVLVHINQYLYNLIVLEKSKEELKTLGFPSRSERDAKVITLLILGGYGKYIKSIFKNYPVGDKYREHNSPDKYLEHTIKISRTFTGIKDDFFINIEKELEQLDPRVVRNKIDYFLDQISKVKDELQKSYLLSFIAFTTKISVQKLEKRILAIIIDNKVSNDMNAFDLFNENIKTPEYWIDPIIPKGAIIVFGGKPSSFKSFLITGMCYSMINKKKFLDSFDIKSVPKILYYDLENGMNLQHWRLKYLYNGNKGDCDAFKNITFTTSFNNTYMNKEIEKASNYDIIVLDSYRRFLNGSENESETTNRFYNEFLKILKEKGKTIIMIHHFRKTKIEEFEEADILDSFRGSGDITAQLDVVYGVIKGAEIESIDKLETSFDVSVLKSKVRNVYPIKNFVMNVTKNDNKQETRLLFSGFKKFISP
jgi:archaellum biogenesis ATPase FlaH